MRNNILFSAFCKECTYFFLIHNQSPFLISKNHYNRDSHILTGHNLRIFKLEFTYPLYLASIQE